MSALDVGCYVSTLINQPWTRDGQHCWRLVQEVERDLFGIAMPAFMDTAPVGGAGRKVKAALFDQHEERARWQRVDVPRNGAVVLMRRAAAPEGFYIHAGVYLAMDGGGVLHTDDPHGVVFDNLIELRSRGWVADYYVPRI